MRTGPFSDPITVTLINRYFVPVHLDNQDWQRPRYGIEPGEENAYIILESPDQTSDSEEIRFLKRLSEVLDPAVVRREMLAFLDRHPDLDQREQWATAAGRGSEKTLERAVYLLEEGRASKALELLKEISESPDSRLAAAQANRLLGDTSGARAALDSAGKGVRQSLEEIRIAHTEGSGEQASGLLDDFLVKHAGHPAAAEAFWLRGWLYHREGEDDRAAETWRQGISRHPPEAALFSQKAYFTLIRLNWELPENVDQEP